MEEYGEQKRSQKVILFAKCRVAKASMRFALVQELASKKPKDEAWANLNQGASVMRVEGDGGMSHQIFSKHVFVRQFTPYQKVDHFHRIWDTAISRVLESYGCLGISMYALL